MIGRALSVTDGSGRTFETDKLIVDFRDCDGRPYRLELEQSQDGPGWRGNVDTNLSIDFTYYVGAEDEKTKNVEYVTIDREIAEVDAPEEEAA